MLTPSELPKIPPRSGVLTPSQLPGFPHRSGALYPQQMLGIPSTVGFFLHPSVSRMPAPFQALGVPLAGGAGPTASLRCPSGVGATPAWAVGFPPEVAATPLWYCSPSQSVSSLYISLWDKGGDIPTHLLDAPPRAPAKVLQARAPCPTCPGSLGSSMSSSYPGLWLWWR